MEFRYIEFDHLSVSRLNMRHGSTPPDVSDILPSVRKRGLLQNLVVRPGDNPGDYEVLAGRRRYHCLAIIKGELGSLPPQPCFVLGDGDDADALEVSAMENLARLDPDEVCQWETFVGLVKRGRSITQIAADFHVTERLVQQRLALGNLLPNIREAYRRNEIGQDTVTQLTLASKSKQKEWLALFNDPKRRAPQGYQLKHWLFGGESVSTRAALFPLDTYGGDIITDLFQEESYFGDLTLFWQKQNEAIAAKRDALLATGWSEVIVMEPGQHFASWQHQRIPKSKGGKVFITVAHSGEVEIHDGYLTLKEARRLERRASADGNGAESAKAARPEVTQPLQTYIDLHRHAAVRAALLNHPGIALRLLVVHAITGSALWNVKPDPQTSRNAATSTSVASSSSEATFAAERSVVRELLGFGDDDPITGSHWGHERPTAAQLFMRLLPLPDADVLRVLAVAMGETLEAGSSIVEAVGVHLAVDMNAAWKPDDAFFDLIRDRQLVNAMVADIAGQPAADRCVAEKLKVQKQLIRDHIAGANGHEPAPGWLPAWMHFPVRAYTERGGLRTAERWAEIETLFKAEAPRARGHRNRRPQRTSRKGTTRKKSRSGRRAASSKAA